MSHREAILDPTGRPDATRPSKLAPRIRDLRDVRLGLLDNAKPNAALVLQTVPHPIASLSPAEIEARVAPAVADVVRILTGT